MQELVNDLNKRLDNSELRFWYFEIEKYFNNAKDGEITLIQLKNTNNDTHIRIWHSDLNTEEPTDEFLYESALVKIQVFINELIEIRNICISERNTY